MIPPEVWRPADDLLLEPNAMRGATECKRCLALTAGPGAGKTEMLAQRADFLLRTGTCRYPKRILAISFKVDASRNLKDRVQRRCGPDLATRFDSYTFHAFAKRIVDRFRPVLTGVDALDPNYKIGDRRFARQQIEFSDLIPLAIQILETSQVARNAVRKTYSDVFLDEFQDCTSTQYKLVKLVFSNTAIRITAVGDTKQRIMAWAGALEGIFSAFATDFDAVPLNMYLNFRSKARLLRMQNAIIRVLDPPSEMPEEQIVGNEGEIYAWGFDTSQHEAEELADRISSWIQDESVPHSEIAILVPKQLNFYADLVMAELEKRDIPYRNEQELQDISTEPAAKLIVDYLLSLYGTREPGAWLRLMEQLKYLSGTSEQDEIRKDWQRFMKAERREAAKLGRSDNRWPSGWEFVRKFLNTVGIGNLTALSPDYESRARLNDVIKETKARIEDQLKIEPDLLKALTRFADDRAVRLLTIHKSKGLEFDTVIVLGVEEETFWGEPDEERCAFFVGISRAKRRLVMTVCEKRKIPPNHTHPNRWREQRNTHGEFLSYAKSLLSNS